MGREREGVREGGGREGGSERGREGGRMLQLPFQLPTYVTHPPPTPCRENWFLDTVYGLFILTVTIISFICLVWLKDQVRGCNL